MRRLILAIVGSLLLAGQVSAQTAQDSWENLKQLRPGQKIEVIDMKWKSLKGTFVAVSDEAILLRTDGNEVSVLRADVLRVSLREHSRRGRNTLIGLGVGAGAGFAIGRAIDCGRLTEKCDPLATLITFPLGAGLGAAIGSGFSGFQTVYRANK